MNSLTKLVTIGTLWGCVALGLGGVGEQGATESPGSALRASFVTEAREQLTKAFALEQLIRQTTTRAVSVEGNHMTVEASRLPRELSSEAWRHVVRVALNI
jgi:hypothetical protein